VARADLLAEAARAGQASGRRRPVAADPKQPARALAGLLADGLIATDDDGASFRLP
ncbi:putative adenine glycosylase, partial [human gut metagenome]